MCSVRELGLCILQTMCMYLTDYFPIDGLLSYRMALLSVQRYIRIVGKKNDNNDKIYGYMTRYLSVT